MHSFFYSRLALTNLKNNRQMYIPFLMTSTAAVMMFYNIVAMTLHSATVASRSLTMLMQLGCVLTALFSFGLLFYTSSFLVKRRFREFGLFNLLGMEKRHISRVMLCETLFTGCGSIAAGLVLGILFNGVFTLLLYKLLAFNPVYNFEINPLSLALTVALFLCVFTAVLLSNLYQMRRVRPIELLSQAQVGEREPKTKWLLSVIGVLTLGAGYWLALTLDSPLAAFKSFFLAIVLVMIGTYCLFTSASIAVLKLLRKNKNYYYQTKHFTTVSGMIYRMKKNAAGLASICLLGTASVIMLSTTVSMYVGVEDILKTRFPTDITFSVRYTPEDNFDAKNVDAAVDAAAQQNGRRISNRLQYGSLSMSIVYDGQTMQMAQDTTDPSVMSQLSCLSATDYRRLTGVDANLGENEILLFDSKGFSAENVNLFGTVYRTQRLDGSVIPKSYLSDLTRNLVIVLPSEQALNTIYESQFATYGNLANALQYVVYCDVDGTPEQEIAFVSALREAGGTSCSVDSREFSRTDFFEIYGGLLFLGIFLGSLTLMAMVLIIYYKQVVEGFEDRERFVILQKVGMSNAEVKQTIHAQILSVFALPIAVAVLHTVVSFPLFFKLLQVLNLSDVGLFAICTAITAAIFAAGYLIVYLRTARVYYRIVHT